MAVNAVFQENGKNNRARVVPEGTEAGDFLMIDGRPAVAYTDRGDATRTYPVALGATITRPSGGVGFAEDEAGVAFDGTWDLPVTGVDEDTAQDVAVYFKAGVDAIPEVEADPEEGIAGSPAVPAVPAELVLTSSGNTLFGYTDYPKENYSKRAGIAPVRIGA